MPIKPQKDGFIGYGKLTPKNQALKNAQNIGTGQFVPKKTTTKKVNFRNVA